VNYLTITLVMRAERQEFNAVGTSLHRAHDVWRDPNRVKRPYIDQLVIELHPALASKNYVHLLGTRMPMRKRRSLAGPKTEMRDSGLLRLERRSSDACLPSIPKAVRRRHVLNIAEVDLGV
jgi:hypothetical protein